MTSPRMTSEQRISPRWPNGMVVRVRPLFVRGLFYCGKAALLGCGVVSQSRRNRIPGHRRSRPAKFS